MPHSNDPEVSRFLEAWLQVRQFIQASNFNRFQREGLSATQFMTLNLLPPTEQTLSMGELARQMNLAPATVAKTVDSLEARNMVVRTRSQDDKRLILVRITPEGTALQNSARGQFRDQITRLFRAMPGEARHGLVTGLEALVKAAAAADD
jgi:DNA-binding MarR family transcriptional regulator